MDAEILEVLEEIATKLYIIEIMIIVGICWLAVITGMIAGKR